MHSNSLLLFDRYGLDFFSPEKRVLEIGPDKIPSSYQQRLKENITVWHTLELMSNGSNTTYSTKQLYNYPISESSYDVILAGQVMEHVVDIWSWLTELKRILVLQGVLVLITPTSWPYHEAPIDCWRIYPEAMKHLAQQTGFEIVRITRESLEKETLKGLRHLKLIEGRSCFHDTTMQGLKKVNFFNGIVRRFPILKNLQIPTEIAYDMLTVLRKTK